MSEYGSKQKSSSDDGKSEKCHAASASGRKLPFYALPPVVYCVYYFLNYIFVQRTGIFDSRLDLILLIIFLLFYIVSIFVSVFAVIYSTFRRLDLSGVFVLAKRLILGPPACLLFLLAMNSVLPTPQALWLWLHLDQFRQQAIDEKVDHRRWVLFHDQGFAGYAPSSIELIYDKDGFESAKPAGVHLSKEFVLLHWTAN